MWRAEWERLNNKEQETFTRIINLLLTKTFLLRDEYDSRSKSLIINRDYRFVERHYSLLQEYLNIAGWHLQNDAYLGVIGAYNRFGSNRFRLDKSTTYFLYTLRLIYEEQREKLSLAKQSSTTVGELVEKMFHLGLVDKKPADTALREGLGTLKRFNIIEKVEGDWAGPDTRLVIYPSILMLVTNEKINSLYNLLEEGAEDDPADQDALD